MGSIVAFVALLGLTWVLVWVSEERGRRSRLVDIVRKISTDSKLDDAPEGMRDFLLGYYLDVYYRCQSKPEQFMENKIFVPMHAWVVSLQAKKGVRLAEGGESQPAEKKA